jgi:hypothetical protein
VAQPDAVIASGDANQRSVAHSIKVGSIGELESERPGASRSVLYDSHRSGHFSKMAVILARRIAWMRSR